MKGSLDDDATFLPNTVQYDSERERDRPKSSPSGHLRNLTIETVPFPDDPSLPRKKASSLSKDPPPTPRIRRARFLRQLKPSIISISRRVADNKGIVICGIILTVWALIGDDLRLLFTNKPADPVFDGLVLLCLAFFTFEIVVSCLGKDDYFMGFYFGLDVVATLTLVLDLTMVSEELFGGGDDEDDAEKARSSRTARTGARVGRVVRVLRLIRIVKLFKAFQQAQMTKKKPKPHDEFDAFMMDDHDGTPNQNLRESLVGKRLSAKTTQSTIILVLSMLIALPLLSADSFERTPASAEYGADEVLEAFEEMVAGSGTRRTYEEALLRFVYYHNWFTGHAECPRPGEGCSAWYYSHTYWAGIAGRDEIEALRNRSQLAQIQARDTVLDWDRQAANQDSLFNFGTMPAEALEPMWLAWDECKVHGVTHFGFSVLSSYAVRCPQDLRSLERWKFTPRLTTLDRYRQWHFAFYFDQRPFVHEEARMNIIKTAFVCVLLCVASLFFSKDAQVLVLEPVEQMITKVEAIRDNPLVAMKMADDEFKREEVAKLKKEQGKDKVQLRNWYKYISCDHQGHSHVEPMETVVLEKTIIKLGSLLALGFGEAGANIVSHNMRGSSSAGVDAMVAGSRVECIVGTARIQDFITATEVLQGKVMTFVNQIAEIVHGVVDQFRGAVNKNNGDTFLIIWRTSECSEDQVTKLAEMSIVAFAQILGSIHGSEVLAKYRHHPGLQQRLGSHFRVNMSFGLHCGWAIEGAVGSEFKIDASYLSPNVSIATSVERATRTYGVSLLASQAVVELCTADMVAKMRLVDKVLIKGSKTPFGLYSVDLDYMSVQVDEPAGHFTWNLQERYRSRQVLEAEKSRKWSSNLTMVEVFERSPYISAMRRRYKAEFIHVFKMGYQNYVEGEWPVARQLLKKACAMLGAEDGPSKALLRFMETPHQFEAPAGWQGVHELDNLDDI